MKITVEVNLSGVLKILDDLGLPRSRKNIARVRREITGLTQANAEANVQDAVRGGWITKDDIEDY